MYQLLIEKQVQKQLEKIPMPDYQSVKTAINNLAKNPRPSGYKKLKGRNSYRIRVSDYRIIYNIFDTELVVDIIALGHRKDIYE